MEKIEGYKKTKIGWIPEHWDAVKLGKITNKVGSGITPRGGSKVYQDNGIPFFRSQNILYGKVSVKDIVYISEAIHQKMINTQLQPADVLLNITGASIGRCCIFPNDFEKGNVNQHVCIIRPDEIIKSQYLCYILNSPIGQNQIWNFQAGGNREGLNFQQIKSFIIPYPPLPEQNKIASILTTIDDKISSIENQIQQTELLKKGLMEKLLTEGIGHTEFKDTEIGRIPTGWDVKNIEDICDLTSGGTPSRKIESYWNGDVPWVKTGEIQYNTITTTEESITESGLKNSAAKLVPKNSILMAMYGQGKTRGKVAILGMEASLNQACLAVICRTQINSSYLFHYFSSNYDRIRSLSQEGSQKNLSSTLVKNIKVPIPSLPEQQEIASILSTVDDKIEVLIQKKSEYQALKKGLSQQLLTGQMRVKV